VALIKVAATETIGKEVKNLLKAEDGGTASDMDARLRSRGKE
jgi:hypothetical protein